ncbi:hypothetical protein DEJ70_04940 [Wolbachia pipientis wAlbB]|nr:hypothetical protein DEJ70_04940 [Wolbachia pipientis wAlbB]QDW08882.1 hypothetical protein CO539_004915 [Wolbachia pipientis]QDW10079.1 hypothetical protein CO538_004920 [Wolbachia pipientis]THA20598.1 hypothetical protein EJE47_01110 [Wolbachia endosymbiont of Aedes albopictus]CCE76974.1 Protein of unknown function [Wolbachia pipientis wAlbB]
MQKGELTINCRYEPSRLAGTYLADAYEQLLKYKTKEVEENDNGKLVCKSFIKTTGTGEYNRESDCRVGAPHW